MVYYWTTYGLCWTFYPYMLWLIPTGEFTLRDRLLSALKSYLIYYAVLGFVGAGFLFYLWLDGYFEKSALPLQGFIMAVTSSIGLIMIIAFLGFGLISIPRLYYMKADIPNIYEYSMYKVNLYQRKAFESDSYLIDIVKNVNLMKIKVDEKLKAEAK